MQTQLPLVNTLIVTGARSGFGKALLKALHATLCPASALVTSREPFELDLPANVVSVVADLGDASGVRSVAAEMRALLTPENAAKDFAPTTARWDSLLIHNAGNLHPLGPIGLESTSGVEDATERLFADIMASAAVNAASFAALTAAFVALVQKARSNALTHPPPSLVIDISSLAATQPFPSWGVYCANKAFRAMIMNVTRSEAQASADTDDWLHTLSYSPGPLDTPMQRQIRLSPSVDPRVRAQFTHMHEAGELVDPLASASALAEVIRRGPAAIQSLGGAVDYYDLPRAATRHDSMGRA